MRLISALVVAAILTQTGVFATTVYLHRCLAHRALTIHPRVALVFRVYLWLTTGIVPRAWVAVHRKHHAFSDTPQDPHSPVVLGFWAVQLGNLRLYQATIHDQVTVPKYSRDLVPDRLDKLALDRGMLGLAIGTALLVLLLGWQTALLAAGIHAVGYLAISSGVNAIGHTFGKRPFANLATNNQWLAWLSAGEGLHNNHHAAPTAARFADAPRQVDPGWWLVRVLVASRLATVRHQDRKLKQSA